MGAWLLSLAPAETIASAGFIVLIVALLGEVLVFFIHRETLHKELAFGFAILASVGVAIETIGQDAVVKALQLRADVAEEKLVQRVLSGGQIAILKQLKGYPAIDVVYEFGESEVSFFAQQITSTLRSAGVFVRLYEAPSNMKWRGIFVMSDEQWSKKGPLVALLAKGGISAGVAPLAWTVAPQTPHDATVFLVGEKYTAGASGPDLGTLATASAGDGDKK